MLYKIIKITDKNGLDKNDDYTIKRLNRYGVINDIIINRPLVFEYSDNPDKIMLTTNIQSYLYNKNELIVRTKNTIYVFEEVSKDEN